MKDFELWLKEVKAWKVATSNVVGLKDVHGLQLALHLPEGCEIGRQISCSTRCPQKNARR